MALSAVVSGAGKTISITEPGVKTITRPLLDIKYDLVDVAGGKTLTIRYLNEILITSSNLLELSGFGNTILGSTDPVVSATSLGAAQGAASGSGGGGGGTPTDVATGMDTSLDIEAIKVAVSRPQSRTTFDFVRITDGTNDIAIKGSGTQPVTGDSSLVVAISPNSLAMGGGAIASTTPRVTIADNDVLVTNIGNAADVAIPLTSATASTIKGLLRYGAQFLEQLGTATDVVIPGSSAAVATIKQLIRYQAGFLEQIGGAGDITIATIAASPNQTIKSLIRLTNSFFNQNTATVSGFNVADLAVSGAGSRVKSINVTNLNATAIFLQVHSKPAALATGDVPIAAWSLRIPANSSFLLGHGDLGLNGRNFGINTRVGLSSTHATYTAIATLNSLSVEAF
jgi:hypothetical protein